MLRGDPWKMAQGTIFSVRYLNQACGYCSLRQSKCLTVCIKTGTSCHLSSESHLLVTSFLRKSFVLQNIVTDLCGIVQSPERPCGGLNRYQDLHSSQMHSQRRTHLSPFTALQPRCVPRCSQLRCICILPQTTQNSLRNKIATPAQGGDMTRGGPGPHLQHFGHNKERRGSQERKLGTVSRKGADDC